LKIKELSFARVQKSAQECERKGDRSETRWNVCSAECPERRED
jgi:hypothetical protein